MKNHEKNSFPNDLEKDPVWDLLKHSSEVDVSPFFARNVIREIRLHEAGGRQAGFRDWLGRAFKPRAVVAGMAVACGVLLFGVSQIQRDNGVPVVQVELQGNEISELDMDLAIEIEAVEYLGQLMAVADPGELSDVALADLLF